MMEFGTIASDIIYSSRDIPDGSSDFCRVMEQIRILDDSEGQKICVKQDTKPDKKKSKRDKEKKSKSDSEKKSKSDSENNNNNRFWRSKKNQKSRDKSPNTRICETSSPRSEVEKTPVPPDPTKCKCSSPSSPRKPRETVHAQFTTHLLEFPRMCALQNMDEEFRQRSKSDCSALMPHKRQVIAVAGRISPLDSLHVHWPDERKGTSLTTTLRPRSFSHGASGMSQKPILKKGSSGSLRPEYF